MLSKYEIIKKDIIKKIDEGIFKAGEKIYSENELKAKYSVSNTTVVKALNDLVNEGILIRRQGKGTYVRRNLLHKKVLLSEITLKEKNSQKVEEKTITQVSKPYTDKEISIKLGSENGKEKIIHIKQLALINDTIWKVDNRYVLSSKLSTDAKKRLEKGASLSKELNLAEHMTNLPTKMKVKYIILDETSEIFKIMQENNDELEEKKELPVVYLEKVIYDNDGNVITYVQSYIQPAYYEIEVVTE